MRHFLSCSNEIIIIIKTNAYLEENCSLCSELWVSPCGANEGFGRVQIKIGGGLLKHKLWDWESPSCLLFPVSKPKAASSSSNRCVPTRRKCTEKQVVSLFIIITIVTINCVINAIQQLCKPAVSDAVSYLQCEDNNDNNDDVFIFFFCRHGFGYFQASSHCLNHRRPVYTATGFTTVVKLVSSGLQLHISPAETSYLEKVAFFSNRGENKSNISPFWHLMKRHWFLLTSCLPKMGKQTSSWKNKNHWIGDKRFLDTRLQPAVLLCFCWKKSSRYASQLKSENLVNSRILNLRWIRKLWRTKERKRPKFL